MLPRLVFLLENLAKILKKKRRFEYDQIKNLIFGLKRCGRKATEKRKARNHKLPLSRHFLKFKMSPLVNSHTNFPLFSTDFQLSTRMLIFRKTNPETENFFLVSPSLNTSIFTTYLKIASTLTPFEGPDSKSPFLIPKFNFLEQEKVNAQNGKVFKLFPLWRTEIFYPKVTVKR